ncbi:MAG TPA: hypothetical protein VLF67_02160 [Candidatus Saccharimonas sp.]|nr:hypothetical protein [Candidatus Saccharimonas sp.]
MASLLVRLLIGLSLVANPLQGDGGRQVVPAAPVLASAVLTPESNPPVWLLVTGGVLPPAYGYDRNWTPEQLLYANLTVQLACNIHMPGADLVALVTQLQESDLTNLPDLGARNDHDSLGLFQQRPSQGWGTPEQVQDPVYANLKFFEELRQVSGWQNLPLTVAAQAVQRSAFPDAYAKHESAARALARFMHAEVVPDC